MSDNKLELYVNGKKYAGWKSASVKRSLDAMSGSFNLSITDRWSDQNKPWTISPDDSCRLFIGKDKVITGSVDVLNPSFDASSRSIAVTGRDNTKELIDCSLDYKNMELSNIDLQSIANYIAFPFGITVIFVGSPGPVFEKFSIQSGETGLQTIERYAKQRGFLLSTNGSGNLVISKPGSTRSKDSLVLGKNVKSGSANFDHTGRYSDYLVKAQPIDETDQAIAAELGNSFSRSATAKDSGVRRYRPLTVIAENARTLDDCKKRAQWESTTRAAKAGKVTLEIQGWRQSDGSLWRPNLIVPVDVNYLGIKQEMLISDVDLKLDDSSGSITTLGLIRPDAYLPQPNISEAKDPLISEIRAARVNP